MYLNIHSGKWHKSSQHGFLWTREKLYRQHFLIWCLYLETNIMGCMMTLSNGNIFRITGPLWGEALMFFLSAPEQTIEQINEKPVIWDAITLAMTSLKRWKWLIVFIVVITQTLPTVSPIFYQLFCHCLSFLQYSPSTFLMLSFYLSPLLVVSLTHFCLLVPSRYPLLFLAISFVITPHLL